MAERDYLEQALPDGVTLLGQRLRPFSLGHLMLLARAQNLFVCKPEKPPTEEEIFSELVFGVFVCCHTFEDAKAALSSRWMLPRIRFWLWRIGPFNIFEKAADFARYIADGSKPPDLWDPDSDDVRFPGAPIIQRVRLVLQRYCNHTLSEAFNKPWGEAVHDYFAVWEMEERAKIINAEEKAMIDDTGGQLAALDQFLDTAEFKNFLAGQVAAEETRQREKEAG